MAQLMIARVLVVGGEEERGAALGQALEAAGHEAVWVPAVEEVERRLGAGDADVVVLAEDAGRHLGRLAAAQCAHTAAALVVHGRGVSPTRRREALQAGAADALDADAGDDALILAVERAARDVALRRELAMLRARVGDATTRALIGRSAAMTLVRELVGRAAASQAPVVVVGEAGTGKDTVARLVHDLSERASRPLVTVRCAGTEPDALERELFGTAAAEGARPRSGQLEQARGGTVVLDDAPALSPALRTQLARAAVTRTARRVGAADATPVDVRLVLTCRAGSGAASRDSVEDLLARFNALCIELPPLRERRSDVPLLVQHFRGRLATEQGVELEPLSPEAMLPLLGHEWGGNVRELEHWVERAALASRTEQPRGGGGGGAPLAGVDVGAARATLEELERAYILHVLQLERGHQSRAAVRLGIDRRTLYRKLKQYRG
jgi:DNA-binding NtrC family response regulator